jgi:PAS domain S-box-containing protein
VTEETGKPRDPVPALVEESAEDLYEHAPCGYVSTDPAGLVLRANHTLLAWIGVPREQVVGRRRLQDLFTSGGRIFYETHVGPLLRMQGAVRSIAVDLARPSGSPLPVLLNSELRRGPAGEPLLIRTTLFDASDRKEYERELLRARKKAEAADRAKADFISMISHEIRTPLNALMGIAYLLSRTELTPRQQKYVGTLRSSSENLLGLVNQVLDFSKLESGHATLEQRPVLLRKMLAELVAAQQVKADEKGITLALEVDEAVPACVIADPVKLSQVLTNLVGNAIKFTARGGVTVRLQDRGPVNGNSVVRFAVSDTGIGIEKDKLAHIFEDFTQASYDIEMKYGGTGLGLAISRRLVELHRGRLLVESELGAGSTFSFDLALGRCPTPDAVAPAVPAERRALAGLRALVADDNEVNQFVLTSLLKEWSVAFEVVRNGREALEAVAGGSYDVLLLDLRMPSMDGFAATREIRARQRAAGRPHRPIVAVSASMRMGQAGEIEDAGFDAFVGKPVNPDLLYAALCRVTGRPPA